MKLGRKKKRMEETVELNITAFLNLMVILVPFLLITAVFSRMTVLELNLPALNAKANPDQEIKLQLQIVITPEALIVQDGNLGEFKRIERLAVDALPKDVQRKVWKPLSEILIELKSRFPQEQNIALLLDRSVNYKTMIEVMDHVRSAELVQAASIDTVELFPSVSIGDIPDTVTESSSAVSADSGLSDSDLSDSDLSDSGLTDGDLTDSDLTKSDMSNGNTEVAQ